MLAGLPLRSAVLVADVGFRFVLRKRKPSTSSASSSSTSSIAESPEESTEHIVYDGLRYTLTDSTATNEQELEFTFTDCPPVNTKEKDKPRRRKPMTKALSAIRKIIDEHTDMPVKLLIGPTEGSAKEETKRTADLVKGTDYSAASFRRMMPRKIPTSVSDLLGHGTTKQAPDDIFFLTHLLTTIRPRNLTFIIPRIEDSPDRFLIPALVIPLISAGAKAFHSRRQALDTLEVGPLIPVSRDCGSAYHFCFAEWRVKTLMIDCRHAASDHDKASHVPKGVMSFASVLFDPEYGFVRMMAGTQSDQEGKKESGTRIVLVGKSKAYTDDFRDQVEGLAEERRSKSKARLDYASNPAHRLELFKQKMFYLPKGKSKPRPIWSKSS
jgi:hypothetical protein